MLSLATHRSRARVYNYCTPSPAGLCTARPSGVRFAACIRPQRQVNLRSAASCGRSARSSLTSLPYLLHSITSCHGIWLYHCVRSTECACSFPVWLEVRACGRCCPRPAPPAPFAPCVLLRAPGMSRARSHAGRILCLCSPQVSRRAGSHRAGTSGLEGVEPSTRQLGRRDARAEVCAAHAGRAG